MTLSITEQTRASTGPLPEAAGVARLLRREDGEPLATLMLESYRGGVDDGGETPEDARREVARLFAGEFGTLDQNASFVFETARGLAAATVVTRDRVAPRPLKAGEAFLAFSMTSPAWKRRGLARAGLELLIEELRRRGEPRLHLVVTRTNTPAVMLYRSVGFVPGPCGETRGSVVGRLPGSAADEERGGDGIDESPRPEHP